MTIHLKDITPENWEQCIFLTTNKDNTHSICEEFVASNALSLAQSKIEEGWITKAIYNDHTMVGFTMYGYCYKNQFYEICRLMIDHRYQGTGYGKKALLKIIREMKQYKNCNEIFICFDPENILAKRLYENLGFRKTDKFINGELVYNLIIK